MSESNEFVRSVAGKSYEFGFTTDVQTEIIDKGLNEDVIRIISQKKGEQNFLFRIQGRILKLQFLHLMFHL